ncbi:hypothetical protein Aglo01_65650 [Actinokineospora globicatena]|nr:hypothetical protein Aglo01_65650 [Actinokineospora globicatena]
MGRTCFVRGPYDTRGRTAKQGPKSMALSAERRYGYRPPTQNKSAPSSRPGTSRVSANVVCGRVPANVGGGWQGQRGRGLGQSYVVGWGWAWGLGGAWGVQAASVVGRGGFIGTWRGLED